MKIKLKMSTPAIQLPPETLDQKQKYFLCPSIRPTNGCKKLGYCTGSLEYSGLNL